MNPIIHVSPTLLKPKIQDVNTRKYVFRAGVIPYCVKENGEILLLLGKTKREKYNQESEYDWTNDSLNLDILYCSHNRNKFNSLYSDFGGGKQQTETTFNCILRELKEETRNCVKINLSTATHLYIHGSRRPAQLMLFIPIVYDEYINEKFKKILPDNEYEDELENLEWISLANFMMLDKSELTSAISNIRELMYTNNLNVTYDSYIRSISNCKYKKFSDLKYNEFVTSFRKTTL